MKWRRFRATAAALLFASLLVGSLVATPAASAATTATTITTPTELTFFDASLDPNTLTTADTFAIAGTATPDVTAVDILCFYGSTFTSVASSVPVTAGTFAAQANLQSIWGVNRLCHLRAIPTGTDPPTADLTPFTGPRVAVNGHAESTVSAGANAGSAYNYYLYAQQVTGAFDYVSLGGCGLDDGYLFDPSLALTTTTYFCNAALLKGQSPAPTRSELQIDGANAYAPAAAESINSSAAGLPAVSHSYSVDSATGNLVLRETAPLVKCPATTYPPDSTSCASFVSTGVTDSRTITQDHDGHVSSVTDVFTSTDGQPHTLDLLWDNRQRFQDGGGDSTQVEYEFPGQSSFSTHAQSDTVSLPASSPGTILVRMHGAVDGDPSTGQGAIVYDRPATSATFNVVGTGSSEFTLHQTGTVPAGGTTRFRFAYVQDYLASNVASTAQTASRAFLNTLNVSKTGTGVGTVTSAPGGIDCGSTCSAAYSYGTSVALTATPSTGSHFAGWSGACSGTGTCTVTTNDVTSVTATFSIITEKLSVTKKGDGKGRVTSYPAGVSCAKGTCSRFYDYGTTIILRAKAAKGSSFNGWAGACRGKQPCALLMQSTKSVRATFLKDCTVPRLKGKSLRTAKRLLKSHDCRLGKIRHAFSRTVKRGHVISTKPRAGRRLRHAGKVGLVLSG